MAAAGPKVMVPLRHAVRPPCDGSRSPRNHQPFLCPLGFPPCPTVMPHGCRSSEVPLQLSLATCRPTLLRHCPQACVCVCVCPLPWGVPCAHSSMAGDQDPVGQCRPAAPITRGLTATGCSWLPTGSVQQDPTPLPTVSRRGGDLPAVAPWPGKDVPAPAALRCIPQTPPSPTSPPRPPLPSCPGATVTRILTRRSLPAGPGTPGALPQDQLRR